jgi:GNAT superfamily N-acetyltransferase
VLKGIDANMALPVRQRVLWPHLSMDESRVVGDDHAQHLGAFVNDQLVAVASVFEDEGARLRKFAVLPEFQGHGIGGMMLERMISDAKTQGAQRFWCDARTSAMRFYCHAGMQPQGDVFNKKGKAYRVMSLTF